MGDKCQSCDYEPNSAICAGEVHQSCNKSQSNGFEPSFADIECEEKAPAKQHIDAKSIGCGQERGIVSAEESEEGGDEGEITLSRERKC